MTQAIHKLLIGSVLAATLCASAGADNTKPDKPKTKVTQVLGAETYKQMELAQKAFADKNYKGAQAALDVVKVRFDKLNDYEKATLWNLYAAVFRAQDNYKGAIEAYYQVLKQNNLPEGLRNEALFALAQMYLITDDYGSAIKVLNKWFAVAPDPGPDAYVLLAQAHCQLKQYGEAKVEVIKAMTIARERHQAFKESWLGLLRAVFYELNDYGNASKVMEVLVTDYPKDSYFTQLAGLYGLMNEQRKQAEIMHAAYVGGYVNNANDAMNMARLYMIQEAPQRAVDLILAKLKDKTFAADEKTLQLLAQALSLAKDNDESIPVLVRLCDMTGDSKYYNYLGEAYMGSGAWSKAADAFEGALKAKNVIGADAIRIQLGTALFNDKKLLQARDAFKAISAGSPNSTTAANWQKFITSEIERNEALRGHGG